MAVPKRKVSPSRRNKRRSHHALKPLNLIVDKDSGEYRLPHRIDKTSGVYNGMEVFSVLKKTKSDE